MLLWGRYTTVFLLRSFSEKLHDTFVINTFPGKFPENPGDSTRYTQGYSLKINVLSDKKSGKLRKISERFRENFRNSENARKFSPEISRKFSGKLQENQAVLCSKNGMLQSENLSFYY